MSIRDQIDRHRQADLLIRACGGVPPESELTVPMMFRMRQILGQGRRMSREDAWDMERMMRENNGH